MLNEDEIDRIRAFERTYGLLLAGISSHPNGNLRQVVGKAYGLGEQPSNEAVLKRHLAYVDEAKWFKQIFTANGLPLNDLGSTLEAVIGSLNSFTLQGPASAIAGAFDKDRLRLLRAGVTFLPFATATPKFEKLERLQRLLFSIRDDVVADPLEDELVQNYVLAALDELLVGLALREASLAETAASRLAMADARSPASGGRVRTSVAVGLLAVGLLADVATLYPTYAYLQDSYRTDIEAIEIQLSELPMLGDGGGEMPELPAGDVAEDEPDQSSPEVSQGK